MDAVPKETPESRAARMALARAVKRDPSGESVQVRQAASAYALERGRAALGELLERSGDLLPADRRTLAAELRATAKDL